MHLKPIKRIKGPLVGVFNNNLSSYYELEVTKCSPFSIFTLLVNICDFHYTVSRHKNINIITLAWLSEKNFAQAAMFET